MDAISEYVFVHYENEEINNFNTVSKLHEAAHDSVKVLSQK